MARGPDENHRILSKAAPGACPGFCGGWATGGLDEGPRVLDEGGRGSAPGFAFALPKVSNDASGVGIVAGTIAKNT